MAIYILKRLGISVVTIFLLATITFFMLRTIPGSPFNSGEKLLSEEMQKQMEAHYGLDKPLTEQYINFMTNLLKGDFGYSLKYSNRSVNSIIASAAPISASLGVYALLVGYPIGLLLGIISARKRGKVIDYTCVLFAIIGVSVPGFVFATVLQYFFGVQLAILPIAQWKTPLHAILPTLALSLSMIAGTTRTMRASMLEVTSQDYVKTARAKGLSGSQIVFRHQMRNALIPIVTSLGPVVAGLLAGSFVVEQIFAIPGLGRYYIQSITSLDYTMTMGLTIFFGIMLVVANLIVDLLYGIVDPRIVITK